MKLRIAMVGACPFPVPQGSQVLLRETAQLLQQRGHEVHLVVYGYGAGETPPGLNVHRCRRVPGDGRVRAGPFLAKPLLDLALLFELRRVVREFHIDVVHAHNYEALAVALLAGKRPIVYHTHNVMADELPYYFSGGRLARGFGTWLDRALPRRADRVVALHRRLAGYLILHGCAPDHVTVIPPPVDAAEFEAGLIGRTMPAVLYTGNLDAYQNLGLLERAMGILRKSIPQARLMIATADPRPVPYAECVHTPDLPALRAVLAEDHVVAVPRVSWSGYPIKLLNAMAAGKAVVACASAAYPLTDRYNGLVVPDNDAEAFARALSELLVNARLRAELGRHARETILAEYQPGAIAKLLEDCDLRLLRQPPG